MREQKNIRIQVFFFVSILLISTIIVSDYLVRPVSSQSGLVGWWKFDEGSGTIAHDSSGNGNDGTLFNGPTWVDGKIEKALSFEGVDDYVDIAATTSLYNLSQMTVEAWIKPKSDGGVVIDRGFYSSPYWTISVGNSMGGMRWNTGQTTNDQGVLQDSTNIPYDKWTHIALVLIGIAPASHNATWYINGQKKSSAILSTGLNAITSTSNPLLIGKTSHPMYHGYFNGTIDEVRIHDRALSANEIWAEHTRTLTAAGTQTVTLGSGVTRTLTFTWNTSGLAKGNYTISAYATTVQGETDTTDNMLAGEWIYVTMPGDVNGDRIVNILDLTRLAICFGARRGVVPPPGIQPYNPNADINDDNIINILDIVVVAINFGKIDP